MCVPAVLPSQKALCKGNVQEQPTSWQHITPAACTAAEPPQAGIYGCCMCRPCACTALSSRCCAAAAAGWDLHPPPGAARADPTEAAAGAAGAAGRAGGAWANPWQTLGPKTTCLLLLMSGVATHGTSEWTSASPCCPNQSFNSVCRAPGTPGRLQHRSSSGSGMAQPPDLCTTGSSQAVDWLKRELARACARSTLNGAQAVQSSRRPASSPLPCLQAKEGLTPTAALGAPSADGAEPAFTPAPVAEPPATAVAADVPATATQGTQTLADPVPSSPEPAQQTEAGSTSAVREAAVDSGARTAESAQQSLHSRLSQRVLLLLNLLPAQQRLLSRLSQRVLLLLAQMPDRQQRLHRRQRSWPRAWRICRRT